MGWIVYSKDGQTERCVLHKLEYSGTFMGDRSVIATFSSEKKIDFNVFDYTTYRGERFELELLPTVKKVSSREYKYELRFVSLKYELERCMMRNIVPGDNGIVYPTPLTVEFTGDVKYLAERIQACLDAMYGKGTWNITIAEGTESEEKNISMSNQNCWDALSIVNTEYKLNYFIKGRNVIIGGEEPVVDNVFEYGKGKGLYEIERISDTDTGVVTKLRAYGGTRNLDYSYPKLPEWTDSVLPANYALSPLRLMLPSFKTDGKTDYVLASEEAIAKYGIREGVITYDDIYPSITGMKNSEGQAIDEIKSVSTITSDTQPTFTVGLYDLGFDLSDSLTTDEAQLSMKSGSLQGYTFNITKIEKASDGSYTLTLGRNTLEEGDTGNFTVPNKDWNMKAGDKFVLLNILMPQEYIRDAENRLLARAKEYLAKYSTTNYSYNVGVDEIFMARNVNFYNDIMEGKRLTVNDQEIGINNENIIIQSLTIKEGEGIIPTFEVTLNNETTASTLDRIQGQISEVETSVNNNFSSQSELLKQYRKKLDKSVWDSIFVIHKNDPENPERITSVQSLVGLWTNEFLSSKGLNPGSGGGSGEGGATALYQLNDVAKNASETGVLGAGPGKVLTYGTDGKWYAADAIGLDETALGKYLTDNNYAKKSDIPSLSGYATESWVLGKNYITSDALSGYATQEWVNNQGYATASSLKVVSDKLNDFLTGTDTDGIINKWKELEAFLVGQTQTSTLAELLAVKADKATTLSGYGIADAYTKSEINSKLGGYVTTTALNTALAKKVDVAFLGKVFGFIGDNNSEVSINDTEAVITSIKAKFGLWTDEYLSSKGLNPNAGGGSGEGATALYQLNDVAQNANGTGVLGAEAGKVLTYGSDGKWYAAKAGMDEDALNNYLTVNNYAQKSDIPSLDGYATQSWVNTALGNKVDKVSGMGLSQNNFTDALLKKLNGIAEGANKYILPVAKAAVLGGVMIGSTLNASTTGVLNLPEVMTAGTYAKVTTDIYGRVTAGSSLSASDIPALGISKITGLQDALDKKVNKSDFATEFDKAMQRWFVRDTANKGLRPADYDSEAVGIYSDSYVSSKGVNTGTGGGGSDYDRLDAWADYDVSKAGYVLSAGLGWDLNTRVESLESKSITLTTTGTGNGLASFTQTGNSVVFTKANFLTSHQTIYGLTLQKNGTSLGTYTPNSAAKTINITVPTKVSELSNDSGFALKSYVDGNFPKLTEGLIPASYLPSYVDDVIEAASLSAFPKTGESGKIYVALDTNLTYRWSGTTYVEISPSLALGETSNTAYAGDKGKANADAIAALKAIKISAGTGLSGGGNLTANRTISLKVATTEALGGIKVGNRLSIDANGVLSATYTYTLPTASATVLGGVKVGTTLNMASSGVLDIKAVGKAGTYFKVTTNAYGQITSGSNPTTLSGFGITDGFNTVAYSGSGNAITSATFSGHTLTLVKGTTFLTKATFDDLFEKVNIGTTSAPVYAIKAKYGLYTEQFLSSMGLNTGTGGGGGGSDYDRLDTWTDYDASKAGWVLSAGLGNDLNTRVTSLENGAAVTVTPSGTGTVVTGVTKAGTVITVTKGNLAFGSLTNKPTTISGYGITDAYTKTQADGKYVTLSTVQTISGLKTFSNVIRLGYNSIHRVHKDEGNNASGTWWYTANYTAIQAGIGCFTDNNASPRLFMGWGETPWTTTSNLSVSSTALTYKGNSILHSANYNAYAPTKTGGGASGTWTIDVTGYSKRLIFNQTAAVANTLMANAGLYYNQVSSSTDTGYPTDYGHVIRLQRTASSTLTSSQAALDLFHQTGAEGLNRLYLRTGYGDGSKMVWGSFVQLLHTGNYTSLITKIGTATVGGTAKGIYLNGGIPTAMSATVGSTTLPVYMSGGTIMACSTTLGVSVTGYSKRLLETVLTDEDLNTYTYNSYSGRTFSGGGGNTVANKPSGLDSFGLLVLRSAGGYTTQLAYSGADLYARYHNNSTWGNWTEFAHITDNVASATKLQTARTIFGKSFNGTANVAGQALVYGTYTATASSRYANGGLQIRENGMVGSAQTDDGYAPAIGFHWANRKGASLIYAASGFKFLNQAFTGYETIYANFNGTLTGNASSASTAAKLTTARKITIAGQELSFNGTADLTYSRNSMSVAYGKEATYTTTTTADKWYRIAFTPVNINNANGIFTIHAGASGYHTVATINVSTSYGVNPSITQLGCSHYNNSQIKAVRLVTPTAYSGNHAYLEIQTTAAISTTIEVRLIGGEGWSVYTAVTAGSIPSGYSAKTLTPSSNSIKTDYLRGTYVYTGSVIGNSTLSIVSTGANNITLRYNNADATALVFNGTAFKPYDVANNAITNGSASGRWANMYSVLLNVSGAATFSSTVTATGTIASTAGYLKSTLNGNTVQIGSQNSSWAHFQSSVPFYFNTRINVNGHLYPHTNNAFTSGGTSNRWSNVFATAGNFSSYIDIGSIRISYDSANNALKVAKTDGTAAGLYAVGFLSSMGIATGTGGGGGGSDYDRLDNWGDYTADKAGYVLSAKLGNDLNTRVKSLEGGSALTVTTTGSGNAVTAVTKSGTVITVTKGTTFLTSHQSLANYVTLSSTQTITATKKWTASQWMGATSICRSNNTTASNATGSFWYTDTTYETIQFGIGVYTDKNVSPRAYIGWGTNPWTVSSNLTVSSTQLTYKSNNILHAANYNDYAPTKTGTGASGTWGISISGGAAKLTTARTIWGQSFDGTANVSGALSGATTISASSTITSTLLDGAFKAGSSASFGYRSADAGAYVYNYTSKKYLGVHDDGYPVFGAASGCLMMPYTVKMFSKADYEYWVVLLWETTTQTTHRLTGKIYTSTGGSTRYQAADVALWYSKWSTSSDGNYLFNTYGQATPWNLVTCTYGGKTYYALQHINTQAVTAYFMGTNSNIAFTAIKYYTIAHGDVAAVVNNSEINGSIADVTTSVMSANGTPYALTSSNVASATKLQTARTLWGQSFNGTANVGGNLTGVGNITASAGMAIVSTGANAIYLKYNNTDATSVVLNATQFKPFDAANGKLALGSTAARWNGLYSTTGSFSGAVTSSSTIQGTQLKSTVATGTAPLTVASTTVVTNLNADLLDGVQGNGYVREYRASYKPTGTAARWIRIGYFNYSAATRSWMGTFCITNTYSNNENTGFIFNVTTRHTTTSATPVPNITQVSGTGTLFSSVRLVKDTSTAYANVYLEVYYNTTSANNTVYVSYKPSFQDGGLFTLYSSYTVGSLPADHTAIAQLTTTEGIATNQNIRAQGYLNISGNSTFNNRLIIQNDGKVVPYSTSTRRSGVYGVYDAAKIGHIWSMGAAYQISDDGATFGNLYGFAYKHTTNTTGGTMASGHQAVWCENGAPRVAMGTNFWVANAASVGGNLSVTGTASAATMTIKNTEAKAHIIFSRSNFNYITAPASGSIAFIAGGQAVGEATCELIINSGYLYAGTTNATALGKSDRRWSNTYTQLLNVAGAATLSSTLAVTGVLTASSTLNVNGVLNANNATDATSTTAAGAVFDGGVGIAKQLRVGGAVTLSSSLAVPYTGGQWISLATRTNIIYGTSNQSEASAHGLFRVKTFGGNAVVFGGLKDQTGFYGYTKAIIDAGTNNYSWKTTWDTATGNISTSGAISTGGSLNATGAINANSTTDSTSTTTGSIICDGGVGIAKQLRVGSTSTFTGKTTHNGGLGATTGTFSSTLSVTGVLTASSTLNIAGVLNANNTTDATSTTAASLVCDGGVGVVKQLRVGGTLSIYKSAEAVNLVSGASDQKITKTVSSSFFSGINFYGTLGSNMGHTDIQMNIYSGGAIQIHSQGGSGTIILNGIVHNNTGMYSDGYMSSKGLNDTSDMRLKNKVRDIFLPVKDIANAPAFEYTWKDGTPGAMVGSSAQYWQKVLSCSVREKKDGYLSMFYGHTAMVGLISLARHHESLEQRVARLEKENKEKDKTIEDLNQKYITLKNMYYGKIDSAC